MFTDPIEYQVFQNVPSISISEQFWQHVLWQFSYRFHFFLFEVVVIDAWSRYFVELLSRLVCQLTISFHTLLCMTQPCHKTMKKYEDFEGMVISLLPRGNSWFKLWFCNCLQYLCLFGIVVKCIPSFHDQGKMLVLPNRLLYWVLSTSDQRYVSLQPIWCHPHTQIRTTFFHGVRISIPSWKPFSQPYPNRIFSNCLSHNSPAKGWPYRFRSRRTTGSSILDHDFGHLCRGRRIQMSGHSDLEIFNNLWASSIFTWV